MSAACGLAASSAKPQAAKLWALFSVIAFLHLVLAKCRNEKQQVELLERFHREGLECKALLS